ncbi:MAG: hypothetical protein LBB15_00180 [Puniceicoccales bacterium]|nr:hypothetical protein [Puniceicoccales bacterium]
MKKALAIAGGILSFGCLGAFETQNVTLDTGVKFSSEYICHGYMRGKKVLAPQVEVGIPILGRGRIYAGTQTALAIDSSAKSPIGVPATRSEVDPYIGVSYDITELFTLDVGYMHRFYTNLPPQRVIVNDEGVGVPSPLNQKRNTDEMYVSLAADMLLSPSLQLFYNWGSREITIEGSVTYTYNLAQFGMNNVAVELGAKVGYDKASKPYACKRYIEENMGKKHFFYFGTNADLVYHLTEHARVRAGVAATANSAKKEDWPNQYFWHKSFVWFNASVDCSF